MAVASDYGRTVLDLSLEEVMPTGPGDGRRTGMRRRALLDLPGVRADDEFMLPSRSQLLKNLRGLVDRALARGGAFNSDDDEPDLVALCDKAGLTLWEYEAATMRANGLKWSEIGKAQGVSPSAAWQAGHRGFEKLGQFIAS